MRKKREKRRLFLKCYWFFSSTHQRTCHPRESEENKFNPFLILAFFFSLRHSYKDMVKSRLVHLPSAFLFFSSLKKLISFQWKEKKLKGVKANFFRKRKFCYAGLVHQWCKYMKKTFQKTIFIASLWNFA